jgi:hypothetical protein
MVGTGRASMWAGLVTSQPDLMGVILCLVAKSSA